MRSLRRVAMILLSLICVSSGTVWVNAYTKKAADEAEYTQLRETVSKNTALPTTAVAVKKVTLTETTKAAEPDYQVPSGLNELMKTNSSVIGWLTIADTKVDYPICQNKTDNEYFLHRDINGQKNTVGSIYLDSNHDIDTKGLHAIYGHHMKNGTMFKDVSRFTSSKYMKEHQKITIWTGKQEIHLKPVFCYAGKADGSYRSNFSSVDELKKFIKGKCGKDVASDNIFVFITCSYGSNDERTYLICEEEC